MDMQTTVTSKGTIEIPSAWEIDWEPILPSEYGNVPGPAVIYLYTDPETGSITYLTHLTPNWHDPKLDVHPTTEEGFIIAGDVRLKDRDLGPGCYLFRPPGIPHGPVSSPNDLGCTIFQRMSGKMKIIRLDGNEEDMVPITDEYLTSDVAWSEKTDTNLIPWEPIESGGWAGTQLRWVHRNTRTGGGMVMIDIPAGWSGTGSEARGPLEEFVLTGDLSAGGCDFGKWGFAYRPAGEAAGTYATKGGTRLICYWNGANEL